MLRSSNVVVATLVLWFVSALVLAQRCPGQDGSKPQHTKDSIETIKKNLAEKKAVLLDVREESEWNEGHLQQAILLPMSKLKRNSDPKQVVKDLDAKQIIYCHCGAGVRALTAADLLRKHGYDVRPLKQGYKELVKAGLPKAEDAKPK